MQIVLRRFVNFFSKFARLSADFLRNDPIRTIPLVFINGITGILYPLPLVGLAIAGSMQVNGEVSRQYTVAGYVIVADKMALIITALVIGLLIYLIRFFSSRNLLIQVNNWQRALLGRTLSILSEVPDYSQSRPYIDILPKVFHGWASRLASAGVQIGLIFVYGIHSLAQILVLAALIAYLDWRMMAMLIASSIMFLPFYATAMLSIVKTRRTLNDKLPKAQIALRQYVADIEAKPVAQESDGATLLPSWDDVIGIIVVNQQHRALIVLYLLAAVHLAIMLAAFVILFGILDLGLTTKTIVLFAALFFLMRTLSGFIQFLGQLTRNYLNLACLDGHLFVKKKNILDNENDNIVAVLNDGNKSIYLEHGNIIEIDDVLPQSKLDYQHLATLLWPVENNERNNVLPCIMPFSGLENVLEAEQNSSQQSSARRHPSIIAISSEAFRTLEEQCKEKYVWAVYNQAGDDLDTACAKLALQGKAESLAYFIG